jgi:hypothetical protein
MDTPRVRVFRAILLPAITRRYKLQQSDPADFFTAAAAKSDCTGCAMPR